jgi:hypothetical protein
MAAITPQTETITSREAEQVERANVSGKTPVVFIHGLAGIAGPSCLSRPAMRR